MNLNANNAAKSESTAFRPELEPASYPARIYAVLDLGMQECITLAGVNKGMVQKVGVLYQCLEEFEWKAETDPDNPEEDENNPVILKEEFWFYNLDVDLAISTKRYNAVDPKGEFGGDWTKTLDLPVNVTVIHDKKGYARVAGLSRMNSKAEAKAEAGALTPFLFDVLVPDSENYKKLPYLTREYWLKCAEGYDEDLYKRIADGETVKGASATPPPSKEEVAKKTASEESYDDI